MPNQAPWLRIVVGLALAVGSGLAAGFPAEAQRSGRAPARPAPQRAAQPKPPPIPVVGASSLQAVVERLSARPALQGARLGVRIEDAETGEVLADVAGEKRFLPASNMKLLTTAAALDVLGPDFRVRTSVYVPALDGNGTVPGDLILVGRGDPTLSDRYNSDKKDTRLTPLETLADQVVAAGVKDITGDIVGDESYFRAAPLGDGWGWDDLQWYYGAEVSALSAADNHVTLTVAPTRPGEKVAVTFTPATNYVTIRNEAVTSAGKETDTFGIHRGLADNVIELYGALPPNGGRELGVAIHDPARFTAHLFREMLTRRGVVVRGGVRRADANFRQRQPLATETLKEIASIESPPLAAWVRTTNKISSNLFAEMLLRHLGKARGASDKDTDAAGCEVVAEFLSRAGAPVAELKVRDGSGLSRLDNVTPAALTALLRYMRKHPAWEVFYDSLPIAGQDGTLRHRMKGTRAAENLRAKTGTLDDVSALAGYVTAANGRVLVFSFVANYLNTARTAGVTAGDDLGQAMAEYTGAAAPKPAAETPTEQP
ncbi:D-alanyl-D-alanine carboxypeptidase/D-alanyl-D-alanine-endopeptidase [Chloracidobacterium validum]|uniref:D-alanyl-D-alanine carboxypeptidase/D-alanyl-D-alanine-endopeptidase n=1 Tax=Chloracidobacterium validum TaxID=2821543 RepID=A0ABX8BAN7_9BACT|nr:D-alanyl-D-alanine carboxypeptidase/D-alanyl-D-alanine-endopeptidase [Chloracidobacterium validum]QUW03096.1 D-alanyl-D-alanine carboxypeptidase/D-alanyl-D-alanine-endopeptidase [Chloracidobacterium validum]